MNAIAKFDDVSLAFEYVSSGRPYERRAFLCRATGATHWHSLFGDVEEPLPDDIEDTDNYVALPHKSELGLGRQLALQFAEETFPEAADTIFGFFFFQHRGAYAQFKNLLEERGLSQQWFEYETRRTNEALRKWCKENAIEIEG